MRSAESCASKEQRHRSICSLLTLCLLSRCQTRLALLTAVLAHQIVCVRSKAVAKPSPGATPYKQIAENLPRSDRLAIALKENSDFQKVLAVFYVDILEFRRSAYKFRVWQS